MSVRPAMRDLLFAAVACVGMLVVGEGLFRLLHFNRMVHYVGNSDLPFAMAPSQDAHTEMGRYPVRINSRGMRAAEVPPEKPAGRYRILFLGDSVTYGDGVANENLFTAVMEHRLDEAGSGEEDFEVLNAGVKGYSNWDELMFFKRRCLDLQIDLVLVGYCVNDQMVGGISGRPSVSFFKTAGAGPLRMIRETAIYFALFRFIRSTVGWLKGLPPWYLEFIDRGEMSPQMRKNWESSADALNRLADLCDAQGVALGIVAFPIEPQVFADYDPALAQPQRRLRTLCEDRRICHIDLLAAMRRRGDTGLLQDQIHLNDRGHRLAGEEIARQLVETLQDQLGDKNTGETGDP